MSGFLSRFREVRDRQPDAIAIESAEGEELSFAALDAWARSVSEALHELGVGTEQVVALALRQGAEHVAALLGVWYAGAAFLPLDPTHPPARRAAILRDAGARAVLHGALPWEGCEALPALSVSALRERTPRRDDIFRQAPAALAYVIYTSGSTGAPKGVEVTHAGLLPMLEAQRAAFGLKPRDRSLCFLSTAFDASLSDVGTALLAGATLVMESAPRLRDTPLLELIRERRISYADVPPSLLARCQPEAAPASLRCLVVGGEVCPATTVRAWSARVQLFNVYGPTEATICTHLIQCDADWSEPLLGAPLPHVRGQVMRADGSVAAEGEPGELWLTGVGLARGYRHQPALTQLRFPTVAGTRWFRTGDAVVQRGDRWLYQGRLDRQLKLSGRLVAPEEVEAALRDELEGRRVAVVAHRGSAEGTLQLWGFVEVAALDEPALRARLARKLPPWMIPSRFVALTAFPLTVSGKIDLSALPFPSPGGEDPAGSDPGTRILSAFRSTLRRPVKPGQSFLELGGDSLTVLELVGALAERGFSVEPGLLYRHPTPDSLATALAESEPPREQAAAWLRDDVRSSLPARPAVGREPDPGGPLLLTGATGALGSALLAALLRQSRRPLVCLVRAPSDAQARDRLRHVLGERLPREETGLTVLASDLELPDWGLAPEARARLTWVSDVVHCAARVHLTEPYGRLRAANVGATERLWSLTREGAPKRFHFVSTLAVFVGAEPLPDLCLETDALRTTERVFGGYAQSKWAAEWQVRALAERDGVPTQIFRPGQLTPSDWLRQFIRALAEQPRVPDVLLDAARMDLTPLRWAAEAMATLVLHPARDPAPATFHLAGPEPVTLRQWLTALEAEGHGSSAASVASSIEGRTALQALQRWTGGDPSLRALDVFLATGSRFSSVQTRERLRMLGGVGCPAVSPALLRAHVRGMVTP